MPISNQVKSPYFIPKAILDLEIKDEEWEDQDKEILEEIHNQSLEDSLIKDEEWEDQEKEILEEIHNQSLEDSLGETSIVENPYE